MQSEDNGGHRNRETTVLAQRSGKRAVYQLTVSRMEEPGIGVYITYGIRIEAGTETAAVEDLWGEREAVWQFVCLCAREEAAPEHLRDLTENFLDRLTALP